MTLEEIYWIGQTVAAVAVVVSLFYLALQTRQVARGQRSAMHLARSQEITAHLLRLSQPDMAAVLAKAARGERLDPAEFIQFASIISPMFDGIEEQHRQFKEGLVDASRWNATKENVRFLLRAPEMRAMWRMLGTRTGKDFASVVDDAVVQARREPHLQLSDVWHTLAAEERALQPPDFITAKQDKRAV